MDRATVVDLASAAGFGANQRNTLLVASHGEHVANDPKRIDAESTVASGKNENVAR